MTEIVGDWEIDLLDPLVENMRTLATTIAKHDIIEGADDVVAEVREALARLDVWRHRDINFAGNIEKWAASEDAAWWDFWNYLGEHIRGWWD